MKDINNFLIELGCSGNEIYHYRNTWDNRFVTYSDIEKDYVIENMRYIQLDFDLDLLLKLPVFYPDTFTLQPFQFKKYFDMFKREFPNNYADIIEEQFWGFEGTDMTYITLDKITSEILYIPFMEVMTRGEESVAASIRSLNNPATRTYKFISLLKELDVDIEVDDVREDMLLELEVGKWEIFYNAEYLINKGLPKELLVDMLWCCPYIMMESQQILENALINVFGEKYIDTMIEKSTEEDWCDILHEIY